MRILQHLPQVIIKLIFNKVTYDHRKVVNIYIVHEINKKFNISDYLTLKNYLFGVVSLTKNDDIDKKKYSRYGIEFHRHGFFSTS